MDADGGWWGKVMLVMLLVALLAMVGGLAPVTATARIDTPQPEQAAEAPEGEDWSSPVAASAIGDHYHEWSHAIEFFRRGADTR